MSEKKICPNCNSANKINAEVCSVCRVPFDIDSLSDEEYDQAIEEQINIQRDEHVSFHPGACSKCDWIYRPGAKICKKCGEKLTPIRLPSHVIEDLPAEGKSFKDIKPKSNILFWASRFVLLLVFTGAISLLVWVLT